MTEYRGGFCFHLGTLSLSLSVFFIGPVYTDYHDDRMTQFAIGLTAGLVFVVTALILLWFGHKRHKKLRKVSDSQPGGNDFASRLVDDGATAGPTHSPVNALPDHPSEPLYPPMKLWRVYFLLVLSATLYAVMLTYRTIRDLNQIGEKRTQPGFYAVGVLIPLVNYAIFFQMANSIARSARKNGFDLPLHPAALTGLLIFTAFAPTVMPSFLYPLTVSIAAIPWLVLHQQMNRLRLAHGPNWRQPDNRYTWKQRSLLIAGLPLMALILVGSKPEFLHFTGKRLAPGESVSGHTPTYRLQIPDEGWRVVPSGTLFPGTDLELMGKTLNDWVVVHAHVTQHRSLDSFVDARRAIIAAQWRNVEVVETRTLDSGAKMTPLSLARFSGNEGVMNTAKAIFVATAVTPEYTVEAIGQGTKNQENAVQALVESLRLSAAENKP
ncbi:hypothetical protein [Methylocaldum marinum]|nr:hypothetical protein [Methylocaldum marinum]